MYQNKVALIKNFVVFVVVKEEQHVLHHEDIVESHPQNWCGELVGPGSSSERGNKPVPSNKRYILMSSIIKLINTYQIHINYSH